MQPIVIDVECVAIADADTYLEPISAPSNYKDEAKISAYIAEERARQLDKAALDVDLGRIIALGMKEPGQDTFVMTEYDSSEGTMLNLLWEQWAAHQRGNPMLVTFNGLGYDIPMLLRRSLYLGIKAPYIACDRFKHPQVIDLMAVLSMDGKLRMRGLQFYLQRFGYPASGQDMTGADVAKAYEAGDWTAIATHCRMDVEGTAWLAERIGMVPKQAAVGAF